MKVLSIFYCLLVVYFLGYNASVYAQSDDAASGTFYQSGGKIFEIIDKTNIFYQFNLSVEKRHDRFILEIKTPKPSEGIDTKFSFVDFDINTLKYGIKKLAPNIDDLSVGTLTDKILANELQYEKNKTIVKFEDQLSKEKRNIGKLGFRKSLNELNIDVYSYEFDYVKKQYTKVGTFKVENAQIAFGDGVISKINVNGFFYKYDKEETCKMSINENVIKNPGKRNITFYNFLPPIPIRTREQIDYFNICDGNERYWLTAQWQDIDDETGKYIYFVYLSDILFYQQNLIYNYGVYIPNDGKVVNLSDSVEVFDLKKESFINDFDLRIYTDFTGLSADNPNGLIKFMGTYNIKLKSPTFNVKPKEQTESQTNFCEYLNILFNFNKLENDKLIPPIRLYNKRLYATSLDLYRYSKFEIGADWNLIKLQREYYSICTDFLIGAYHTPIDSVYSNNGETVSISGGVNSSYAGLKINLKFFANEHVNFNLGYSFLIPQLFPNNTLKEIYKPITDSGFSKNLRGHYFNSEAWIHNINAEFSIYPDPQDKSSFLFLKSEIVFNSSDNYITLLLGYSLPFSNLISLGQSVK